MTGEELEGLAAAISCARSRRNGNSELGARLFTSPAPPTVGLHARAMPMSRKDLQRQHDFQSAATRLQMPQTTPKLRCLCVALQCNQFSSGQIVQMRRLAHAAHVRKRRIGLLTDVRGSEWTSFCKRFRDTLPMPRLYLILAAC